MIVCCECANWTRLSPDDETAPEGKCGLPEDPGFYPFGYWPNTLASDSCGASVLLSKSADRAQGVAVASHDSNRGDAQS